jgi:hypothetical protein
MAGRKLDVGFWAPVGLLVTLIVGIFFCIAWAMDSYDAEPTSRCIDVEFRIFERNGDFSVVADPDCAK